MLAAGTIDRPDVRAPTFSGGDDPVESNVGRWHLEATIEDKSEQIAIETRRRSGEQVERILPTAIALKACDEALPIPGRGRACLEAGIQQPFCWCEVRRLVTEVTHEGPPPRRVLVGGTLEDVVGRTLDGNDSH